MIEFDSLVIKTLANLQYQNWNWDVVFAQVSGELHKEWYSDGEKDQEKIAVSSGESNMQADIEGPGTSNRITKERPYTAFNRFPV